MGNPLSPTLANIFICKLEEDVVTPHNFPFYERYVDDCFTKRKITAPDNLLVKLNSYHPNKQTNKRQTRKMESTFKLKEKIAHPSHVVYKDKCISGHTYIGEKARNLEVRVNEHLNVNKQSEPAKHIRQHPNRKFAWEALKCP